MNLRKQFTVAFAAGIIASSALTACGKASLNDENQPPNANTTTGASEGDGSDENTSGAEDSDANGSDANGNDADDAGDSDNGKGGSDDSDGFYEVETGEYEFAGTVRLRTVGELLQGAQAPNGEPLSDTRYVLEFDHPVEVTAFRANKSHTQSNDLAALYVPDEPDDGAATFNKFLNKRVSIYVPKDGFVYPADTSIPMGAIRINSYNEIVER
ncbi:hypothetical protein [Corynebacterium aquatimens]|uniref:Secreted protein n=1 Tax=Corynebacterium aquatimens TaxID=1190508 RepID=A0A931DYY0_9CORY|nr:hypothetical protein [Corynebacterium aquatimens]MBG6121253.1 hypothetical protein [Corynebacterium aquatimens]WJY66196.1 hypothetical protein CAQUA_07500 [Corynebacterium aquatimens]